MAIIKSLLQTDMYKLTMLQSFLHKFPGANAKYRFKNRTVSVNLAPYVDRIRSEINYLSNLSFSEEEINYLSTLKLFTEDFLDFLQDFRLKKKYVNVSVVDEELDICVEGPLVQVMLYEIYVLSIVHEIYSRENHTEPDYDEGERRLRDKIRKIRDYVDNGGDFEFADFGTRRAFNSNWHEHVLNIIKTELHEDTFIGTSNLYLARNLNLRPIGTFAHEYVQAFQGMCPVMDSQKHAMTTWLDEYNGKLGIVLTDTLGMDKFLQDFDYRYAVQYNGVRHDSGCPFDFTDRIVNHYEKLGIEPMSKTIVFSDGLDVDLAIKLAEHCKNVINCSFGIGTNLSNDLGYGALQIVMKMVGCGMRELNPVAKISDTVGKGMCENYQYLQYLNNMLEE